MQINNAIAAQSMAMSSVETKVLAQTQVLDMAMDTVEQAGTAMAEMMAQPVSPAPNSESMNFRV